MAGGKLLVPVLLLTFGSARFKVPREFHFREALPKGGTGKILKAELREPFWKGHDARVQ